MVIYILGVLAVVIILFIVTVIRGCWNSIPYNEWVEFQRTKARDIIVKQERKKRRLEKWIQLRKKYLFFWRS